MHREIKETMCYVACDYDEEVARASSQPRQADTSIGAADTSIGAAYELLGGESIFLCAERFQCPEALFKPSLIGVAAPGVHEMVSTAPR